MSEDRKRHVEEILEESKALFAEGFEGAFIGMFRRFGQQEVALYDYDKCISILMKDGLSYEEAAEHFEFNVIGAWVGEGTPGFAVLI